jgi:hypothetical protein
VWTSKILSDRHWTDARDFKPHDSRDFRIRASRDVHSMKASLASGTVVLDESELNLIALGFESVHNLPQLKCNCSRGQ